MWGVYQDTAFWQSDTTDTSNLWTTPNETSLVIKFKGYLNKFVMTFVSEKKKKKTWAVTVTDSKALIVYKVWYRKLKSTRDLP